MTEGSRPTGPRRPWHLWLVGVLALLWNSMGALDYTMTQTRNADYLSSASPEQLAWVYAQPAWVDAAWAIGVWGGLAGAALLLLRRRHATGALLASFLGALTAFVHNYGFAGAMDVMGSPGALAFGAMILIVALALPLYSGWLQKRGHLA